MTIRVLILSGLCVLGAASGVRAESCGLETDRHGWYAPDYVRLQTGNYQGFLTLGTGYLLFGARLDLGVSYGWVPEVLGGQPLHSMTLSIVGRARGVCLGRRVKVNWSYLYGGLGVLFILSGDGFYFVRVPERYGDSRYYRKTAIRTLLKLGTEFELVQRFKRQSVSHGLYWELAGLDEYFYMWWRNREGLSFAFPWSSTLGYRLRF
jgi:hypothetical protein